MNEPGNKQAANATQTEATPATQKYQATPEPTSPTHHINGEAQWQSTALCPLTSPTPRHRPEKNPSSTENKEQLPSLHRSSSSASTSQAASAKRTMKRNSVLPCQITS